MIPLSSSRQARALLRTTRERLGISQSRLARILHLSDSGIAKRESQRGGLDVDGFIPHARALGYRVVLLRERAGSTGTGWPG